MSSLKVGENTTVPLIIGNSCVKALFFGLFEFSPVSRARTDTAAKQSRQSKHSNNLLTADTFP